jgi:hypothetical protein
MGVLINRALSLLLLRVDTGVHQHMLVLAVRRPLPACISIRTALCYVGARRPRLDASNAEDSCTTDSSLHVPCVRASCPSLHTHRSGGASAIKRCFTILSSQDRRTIGLW